MTVAQKNWQRFITVVVLLLLALNMYLMFTTQFPFDVTTAWQAETLGAVYAAINIVVIVLMFAVELIPLFLLKWILEKALKQKLS